MTDSNPAATMIIEALHSKHGSPVPVDAIDGMIELFKAPIESLHGSFDWVAVRKLVLSRIIVDVDPPVTVQAEWTPWVVEALGEGSWSFGAGTDTSSTSSPTCTSHRK